jgi:hypothetical protein
MTRPGEPRETDPVDDVQQRARTASHNRKDAYRHAEKLIRRAVQQLAMTPGSYKEQADFLADTLGKEIARQL